MLVAYSKKIENLTSKNIPAVTIVAAWIKADTGVGPSIASGNHICNPTCADLPIAPNKKQKQAMFKKLKSNVNIFIKQL